jgi:multiple sugar transport system permease protein
MEQVEGLPPVGPAEGKSAKGGMRTWKAQQMVFVLMALVPMAIVFLMFWVYPMIDGVWGSLTAWRAFNPERTFIGLQHYARMFSDPVFGISVKNTFIYTLIYVPASIVIALVVALMVEGSGRLRPLFRTIYFLPVVTSEIATGLIWAWLYQPSLGLINQILEIVGLPTQRFLLSPDQALISIIIYALWKNMGYNMILFMAGLNSIDVSFEEAAKVDGANRWQIFWKVTLPLLRPTMVFVLITGIITTMQVFGPIFVMTSREANDVPGGPLNATKVMSVYQWQIAFRELDLGYGAAIGIVLFGIILLVTLAQARLLRTGWEY